MHDDISVRVLSPADIVEFAELVNLFSEVFEMKGFVRPSEGHLQKVLGSANFLVLVAQQRERVIGGLTVYILERYYAERPVAYLYDLAVGVEFQRQGIGRKLISALVAYCREHGLDEMFVQAESADDDALEFYRATSPDEEREVVMFTYLIKE